MSPGAWDDPQTLSHTGKAVLLLFNKELSKSLNIFYNLIKELNIF